MRQVSVNGQCDVILLAVRPSGRRPENKLRPSHEAENWLNESDIVVGIVRRLKGDIDHEETHSLRCF